MNWTVTVVLWVAAASVNTFVEGSRFIMWEGNIVFYEESRMDYNQASEFCQRLDGSLPDIKGPGPLEDLVSALNWGEDQEAWIGSYDSGSRDSFRCLYSIKSGEPHMQDFDRKIGVLCVLRGTPPFPSQKWLDNFNKLLSQLEERFPTTQVKLPFELKTEFELQLSLHKLQVEVDKWKRDNPNFQSLFYLSIAISLGVLLLFLATCAFRMCRRRGKINISCPVPSVPSVSYQNYSEEIEFSKV